MEFSYKNILSLSHIFGFCEQYVARVFFHCIKINSAVKYPSTMPAAKDWMSSG
jgi:hypothetical protein